GARLANNHQPRMPSVATSGPSIVPNMWTGVTGARYCVARMQIHSRATKRSAGNRRSRGSALVGAGSSPCQAGRGAEGTWEAMSLMRYSRIQGSGGWERKEIEGGYLTKTCGPGVQVSCSSQ